MSHLKPNPPGVMEKNNALMLKMDRKRENSRLGRERKHNANHMREHGLSDVLSTRKSIHRKANALRKRTGKLEKSSKKAGYYVHGHKNLGDVYEA